jgi:hypothetical protein
VADLEEIPISPPVGVVKTDSLRQIEGRWADTINVRFVNTRPQKIGGWVKAFTQAVVGIPRSLHAWRDRSFNAFMAVGTYIKLYVYDQGLARNDITPIRSTGTLPANPITTAVGSNLITLHDTAHGAAVGDLITIAGATAVGGITPNVVQVPVETVIDADNYTYRFTSNATSSATGGGAAVVYTYEIPVGVELGTFGYGWGVGGWGLGTWGTARGSSTISIEPRIWSLDNFGTLLLATYNGGTLYKFDPTQNQPWPRATLASSDPGMPTNMRAMLVTNERFVVALCDGMQVSWPSQGTIDDWTPTLTNTANIRTLTEGSKLVGGKTLGEQIFMVWSDAAAYLFQYTGAAYIYSSRMVGKNCGLLSPNAAVTAGGIGYWAGTDNFWMYDGSVHPMPNVEDIRRWVYEQLNIDQGYQCNATYNPRFDEVWFFFTINGENEPSIGLIYSLAEKCWAPLYFGRTGGAQYTQGDTSPYFGGTDGFIYKHEQGLDADGAELPYQMLLAPLGLSKGGRYNFLVETLVNDFFEQSGDVTQTLISYDRLNNQPAPLETLVSVLNEVNSEPVDCGIAGRYVSFAVSGSGLGCYIRLGIPVAFIRRIGDRS